MSSQAAVDVSHPVGPLDIPGTWNVRDVGGRATPVGASAPLRTGVLYRTASLSSLTTEGVDVLADLAIDVVLDLRSDDEVSRHGADVVPATVRVLRRAMNPATAARSAGTEERTHDGAAPSADTAAMVRQLVGSPDPQAVARAMMLGVYEMFVTGATIRATIGYVLTDIATSRGPALVHCSAGKDRTGWIVSLVQHLAGIDEEDRLAEYLASAEMTAGLAALIPPIPGLDAEALTPLLTVEPDYLLGAWSLAEQTYGSIDAYLDVCGVSDRSRGQIVEKFAV